MLALTLACAISEEQEVALGQENAAAIDAQLPLVRDAEINQFVSALGNTLARETERADLEWHFRVVDSPDVNAFAVPGGFIYLNRGLIERMDSMDELAGVLGHEIGHVVLRHSVDQMENQGRANVGVTLACTLTGWCDGAAAQVAINVAGSAWFARHSRNDEAEADSLAVVAVVSAGISPSGVPALFETLLEQRRGQPALVESWFASHPLEESRIDAAREHIAAIDPVRLQGLTKDSREFQEIRRRLAALPPSPAPGSR